MGEAKTKEARQTRQHHVEIVCGPCSTEDQLRALADRVELGYRLINDAAMLDDMVVVSTTQTTEAYVEDGLPYLAIIVTAQRVARATLREMEMRATLGQRVPPIGGKA